MREAFELAGLRMLSEFNLFIGHNFNCDLDNGDSPMLNPDDDVSVFIGVCSDFNTLSEEDRVLHTITTLLATSTRSNEPTGDFNGNLQFSLGPSAWGMAQWAFQRWEAHGECLHSTLHLDERPLDHERRQFDDDEYDYYIHNLNDSNTSIAQGWQRAFDLLEPGLRFIYRLALLDQADRERMWHYGDELSPAHYFGAYTDRRFAMVFHRLLTMMDRIQHTKIWIWYWPNDNSFGGRPTTLNNTIWFRTVYSQGDERSRGISMLHELMHDSMSGGGLRDWRRDYCDGGGRTTAGGKCYSALGADFGAGNDASCGVLAIRCRNPEHACSNIPNYVSWLDFRLEAGWRGWPPDTEVIGVPAFNTTDPAGEWVPDPVADPPFFDDPTPEQFIALVPETADWWEEGEFTPSSGDPSETGVECDEHALANNTWMCH